MTNYFLILQCASQLKSLYAEGIEGCHMEFAAYNLLCVIMHSNNNRDLVSSMSRLVMVTNDEFAFLNEFCKLTWALYCDEFVNWCCVCC